MLRIFATLCIALMPGALWAQDRILTLAGLPVWDSAPLLYLVETQPLANQDIRFEFRPWHAPEQLGAFLVREDVHIASAPGMLTAIFAARGLELTLLGTSAPDGNIAIVSRQAEGDIAVPFKGGMPDLILRALNPEALNPRYTATPVEAMQLLLSGQVAAAFLAEPFVTIANDQAAGSLKRADTCDLWRRVHDVAHCPATGVYLGSGLSDAEAEAVATALAAAYSKLADQPDAAARLLSTEFPMLADAPLAEAFAGITHHYQPICKTTWLMQTLQVLEPHAPYSLADESLFSGPC